MPKFNFFKRKQKKKNFLVIEIGLEKITCAIFEKEERRIKLIGVGKKKFSSQEEVFDAVLEALDSLAAIVPDFPSTGSLGISGGSLETITTIARYVRDKPKKSIDPKETKNILHKIVEELETKDKEIFFSTVAGAQIDGVRVTNPLGLKGEKIELSCFVALKDKSEMELLDRLMGEIDLKVEKVIPTSFTVAKTLESKKIEDALLFRVGVKKSEITVLIDGHVSEILPVGLGLSEPDLLSLAWQAAVKKMEKNKLPNLIWVFADNDQADPEKAQELLVNFDWKSKLGFEIAPKVEIAGSIGNFSATDIGIYALSVQEIDE